MRYVVVENTPGYLPESDAPAVFETPEQAREYLKDEVERYCDHLVAGSEVEPNVWWDEELTEAYVVDPSREHDLGRVFQILTAEDEPCRDCGEPFPFDPERDRCDDCLRAEGVI